MGIQYQRKEAWIGRIPGATLANEDKIKTNNNRIWSQRSRFKKMEAFWDYGKLEQRHRQPVISAAATIGKHEEKESITEPRRKKQTSSVRNKQRQTSKESFGR